MILIESIDDLLKDFNYRLITGPNSAHKFN